MSAEGLSGGGPVLVRYCNRAIGAAEIDFIRTTIAAEERLGWRVYMERYHYQLVLAQPIWVVGTL